MILLIAIVLGALVGAAASGEAGALAGALFGWLIVRSLRQQREIESCAARRRRCAGRGGAAPRCDRRSPLRPGCVPSAATLDDARCRCRPGARLRGRHRHVAPTAALDVLVPVASGAAAGHHAGLVASAAAIAGGGVPPAPPRDPLAPLKRWLFGGNTIVKAGIGILFVGLAFLAKYASEHAHLPVEVRLAAIGAAAVVLLGFGWRLRLSRPDYAQVLQGGAVAVLYLTLFAAFRFYGVLGALPAFVLMVAVAALAAALAVLQDARALAIVGALGGFATPLIVSTGSNNYVALFAYYFVLDAGIAAVAWSKTWRPLNLVGFVATFVVATAWGVLKYRPDDFATSQAFLIAFFLLFVAILVLPARRLARVAPVAGAAAPHRDAWVNSSLLFGLPTVTFALEYGLVRGTPFGAALAALVLAGFYVLLATWMKKRPELGITFDARLAIATVFLTLVIPFALDERSTAGAWTLEGAGLVWIGFRQRRGLPRAFGYLLLAVAGLAMLLGHERHGAPTLVFNAYLFNGLMAAAASLAAAFFVHRSRAAAVAAPRRGGVRADPDRPGHALARRHRVDRDRCLRRRALHASSRAGGRRAPSPRSTRRWRAASTGPRSPGRRSRLRPFLFLAALVDAVLLANPLDDGGGWAWPLAFAAHAAVLAWATPRLPKTSAHAVPRARRDHPRARRRPARPRHHGALGRSGERLAVARLADRAGGAPARAAAAGDGADLAGARAARGLSRQRRRGLAAGLWLWTLVANVASDGSAARRCRTCRSSTRSTSASASPSPRHCSGCAAATASRPGRWRWPPAPASSGSTRSWCAASTTTAACRTTSTPGSARSRCRPASRCCGRRSRW